MSSLVYDVNNSGKITEKRNFLIIIPQDLQKPEFAGERIESLAKERMLLLGEKSMCQSLPELHKLAIHKNNPIVTSISR